MINNDLQSTTQKTKRLSNLIKKIILAMKLRIAITTTQYVRYKSTTQVTTIVLKFEKWKDW